MYIRQNCPERITSALKDNQEKRHEGGFEGWHENPSMSRAKCNRQQVPTELPDLVQLGHFIRGLLYKHLHTKHVGIHSGFNCLFIHCSNE